LASSRLKKAVQIVNQTLNELKVEKRPDKTFIGRIAKGFDFLGYSFEPKGLSIAPKTLANFLDRIAQLYEQGATVKRIGKYVRNWLRWSNPISFPYAPVTISCLPWMLHPHQKNMTLRSEYAHAALSLYATAVNEVTLHPAVIAFKGDTITCALPSCIVERVNSCLAFG